MSTFDFTIFLPYDISKGIIAPVIVRLEELKRLERLVNEETTASLSLFKSLYLRFSKILVHTLAISEGSLNELDPIDLIVRSLSPSCILSFTVLLAPLLLWSELIRYLAGHIIYSAKSSILQESGVFCISTVRTS